MLTTASHGSADSAVTDPGLLLGLDSLHKEMSRTWKSQFEMTTKVKIENIPTPSKSS
jgi:hypothetical protein